MTDERHPQKQRKKCCTIDTYQVYIYTKYVYILRGHVARRPCFPGTALYVATARIHMVHGARTHAQTHETNTSE